MAWKWRHISIYGVDHAISTPFSRRLRRHVVFAKLLYYGKVRAGESVLAEGLMYREHLRNYFDVIIVNT